MAQWYRNALSKALNKEVDWDSDTIKLTLHTSTYTPNLDTHTVQSDLTNELTTASGYTAGGVTLASCTRTYTAANSWATTAAVSTAYVVGNVVRPSTGNGFLYRCVVAGTSSGTAPTWPTVVGTTVADNTVTWECVGSGIIQFTATNPTWATATFTARYAAISDTQTGVASTSPLIGLIDFGSNQTGGGGTFQITFDTQGVLHIYIP